MKVVWLFPPSVDGGFPNISQYRFYKKMPIRISIIYPYLAAMGVTLLKKHGYDVKFFDCPTMNLKWSDVEKELLDCDLLILEGRTPIIFWIYSICERIRKEFPKTKIALYGDHVSHFLNESLCYCDFIIKGGNYDTGALYLADQLNRNIIVNNVVYTPTPSLDDLPFCDRELVDWRLYYESWRHRDKFFWVMSSRGCWYNCVFCAWAKTFWNNTMNYRSPRNVSLEYKELFKKYGSCEVLDDADVFDFVWGYKFAKKLLSLGLSKNEVLWANQTHPNQITDLYKLRVMEKSGLKTVKLGVESLNQPTLNFIRKQTTVKQIVKAIDLLKKAKIFVHCNLMIGFPNETKKDVLNTLKMIKKLDPNQVQFSLIIPYPNTDIYEMAKDNDWLLVGSNSWNEYDATKPMLSMKNVSVDEIASLYRYCWSKFYFDPKYVWSHIKGVRHWEGVKQLWRGFISIRFGHMRAMD